MGSGVRVGYGVRVEVMGSGVRVEGGLRSEGGSCGFRCEGGGWGKVRNWCALG